MKQFPTKSYTNTQTYYQNALLVHLYTTTSFILVVIGVLLTLKIVLKKEQRARKLQQQIQNLEHMYSLEHKDKNIT